MEWECKGCGTVLNVECGEKVAVCDFCGMRNTVPTIDSEEKLKEFMQASSDRYACRFDVAKDKYCQLIEKYPSDNEAYWGKLLCEYGIEYVDDFDSEKKIPTCHRTVKQSIFDNKDYKLIISRATNEEKRIYETEAKEIDRIQKAILKVAEKEEPYDIFICYKESAANGKRTLDSQYASKIYSHLTNKGYKVFFSRVTLKSKVGEDYEPIIYSALSSSKVMLLVAMSQDNVNASWVRNEWSRYLEFMRADNTKSIMPCIAQMDAYELPSILSRYQVANLSDLDFCESISRQIDSKFGRIDRISDIRMPQNATKPQNHGTSDTQITAQIKQMNESLSKAKWNEASEIAEKILQASSNCADAYVGKLFSELKIRNRELLKTCDQPFDDNIAYQLAIGCANPALKLFLESAAKEVKDRFENKRKEQAYNKAIGICDTDDIDQLGEAIELFETAIGWSDSSDRLKECTQRLADIREKAEAEKREKERIETEKRNREERYYSLSLRLTGR